MAKARIIVDSSYWIDHINGGHAQMTDLLKQRRVLLHPMIYAEIALGSITSRRQLLQELQKMPYAPAASHAEVLAMIEWLEIYNAGIGYVDAHLLAATKQVSGALLWTKDKRLQMQAERLNVAYTP